jgi:hypothetical protein
VPEKRAHHLFVSAHNAGALELVDELCGALELAGLKVTSAASQLQGSACILILLRSDTWSSSERNAAFLGELEKLRHTRHPGAVLLAHEAPDHSTLDGRADPRCAVEFDQLMEQTPASLRCAGLYNILATELKGGAVRTASLAMLGQTLEARIAADKEAREADDDGARNSGFTFGNDGRRESSLRSENSSGPSGVHAELSFEAFIPPEARKQVVVMAATKRRSSMSLLKDMGRSQAEAHVSS